MHWWEVTLLIWFSPYMIAIIIGIPMIIWEAISMELIEPEPKYFDPEQRAIELEVKKNG